VKVILFRPFSIEMYRIFKRYNMPSASYDGIPEGDVHLRPLDPIGCAGCARTLDLYNCARSRRGLKFAEALRVILYLQAFLCLMLVEVEQLEKEHTSAKWKPHLDVLIGCGVLIDCPLAKMKYAARYFAVAKGETEARAIVNLRGLSRLMTPPTSTNLPEIETVLKMISESTHLVIGDWRHFFHQFRVTDSISNYFGILCGSYTKKWTCLPMGWSHSPKTAQTAAWCLLLEAAFRANLASPEEFQDLHSTPTTARIRGGTIAVWYDNVILAHSKTQMHVTCFTHDCWRCAAVQTCQAVMSRQVLSLEHPYPTRSEMMVSISSSSIWTSGT
jgi:hypothetical protein